MSLVTAIFAMVAFLAIAVGALVVLGPSGAMSFLYILFAVPFSIAIINIARGKAYLTNKPPLNTASKKLQIMLSLINVLGGMTAFIVYWLTKDHLAAAKSLTTFAGLSLLLFILFGGKTES